MSHSLLVVTSQPSFGEHIRQSLEETSPAHVEIVDGKVAALYKLQHQEFTHVFLDMDLQNGSILDLGLALREEDPNLRLVIISAKKTPPRLEALRPWTLLRKPFFLLSDLLRVLAEEEKRAQEVQPHQSIDVDLNATRVSKANRPETPGRRPNPEELIETRPQRPRSITEIAGHEPVSSGMYNLTYACLLVPRFSSHHLTGDLAQYLSVWIPNICIAFGWRLEHLSVRPDYLQWVVNVPPTSSPGYIMRIMRKQTSGKIFEDFPRQKRENPSGDFWAPGYLIMGGNQPHTSKLVEDYIKRTRERQGA